MLRTQTLVVKRDLLSRGGGLRGIPELPDVCALRFRHTRALASAVGKYHYVLCHVLTPSSRVLTPYWLSRRRVIGVYMLDTPQDEWPRAETQRTARAPCGDGYSSLTIFG